MDFKAKNFSAARRPSLNALQPRAEMRDRDFVRYVLNWLGTTWFLEGKYHEGIKFLSDYVRQYSDDPQACSQRAPMLWFPDEVEGTLRHYSRDLESRPYDVHVLSSRGPIFVAHGE